MNRSNPSTVEGGGEMNRETSSVVSIANSDGASEIRSSRSVTPFALSTGRPSRQSVLTTSAETDPMNSDSITMASSSER
jgi:hypothetical protein